MKKYSITLILLINIGIISCNKDNNINSSSIKIPNTKTDLPQERAATIGLCSNLPASMRDGLVAYYPFCGNANDVSSNNNNPSFNKASLIPDRFGNPNSAYCFNGKDEFIKGPADNFPTNSRTISIWFKAASLIPHNTLLAYGGGICGTSFLLFLNHGPQPNAYAVTGHCEFNNCFTNSHYPPSGWNNWIISTGNGATKFYLNGELIHTCSDVSFSNTDVTGKDFSFGVSVGPEGKAPYTDTTIDYFNGYLDDIVIYNRVLSDTEAQNLYQYFKDGSLSS
ncbi:LamG domain-containing protein [Mucilaginibacter sp.]|uniref:LamG domain-containing protein n=1 Tax=Mucilaginibacter sp. TaxID=1882438 RepID=UPI002635B793|nr:LamG domain-containing protein [Mucilaginibacter sp.]MDB5127766.1 hypothetical protein [Mucilaginibacter sp.]